MHKKLYIVWIICFINLTMLLSEPIKIMWQADLSRASNHSFCGDNQPHSIFIASAGNLPLEARRNAHTQEAKSLTDFSITRNTCFIAEVFENTLSVPPSYFYRRSSRLNNFADYSTSKTDPCVTALKHCCFINLATFLLASWECMQAPEVRCAAIYGHTHRSLSC